MGDQYAFGKKGVSSLVRPGRSYYAGSAVRLEKEWRVGVGLRRTMAMAEW